MLGSDRRVTNFGGGNTSAKVNQIDPATGETVAVMYIKGSGGDLGTLQREGLAVLALDRIRAARARYRGVEHEDEMFDVIEDHCCFGPPRATPSIDTASHAFVPMPHVDHVHPDAIIALATSRDGPTLTVECFGEDVVWLPWQRPGFE